MELLKKKKNHLIITLYKKEYVTIYVPDKTIRLLIENRNDKIYVTQFEYKN